MQSIFLRTRSCLAVGVLCLSGAAASAQSLFDALPPLPKVIPMMPPTELHSDTQGEIRFKSSSPYDLDVLLNQPAKAEATMGMGKLFLPKGASANRQVPAMVVLPGSAGAIPGRENETAQMLADNGIAALLVDNFKPRGISEETEATRMRADVSQAKPATEAVKADRGKSPKARKTRGSRGAQIQRTGLSR